jgi:D-serine dehydratase
VALQCVQEGLFDGEEVIVSAGGSAIFDLVAARLNPSLGRPVRPLLRSGCYVTHDHGTYTRMLQAMAPRLGCDCGDALRPALEVWALVQSRPEPGLAIVGAGKRDLSFDMGLPTPIARAAPGVLLPQSAPAGWRIDGLNDQHAYLRWDATDAALDALAPVVGERIGLGISHPCTTFDKWRWMPVVEADYRVSDAISIDF